MAQNKQYNMAQNTHNSSAIYHILPPSHLKRPVNILTATSGVAHFFLSAAYIVNCVLSAAQNNYDFHPFSPEGSKKVVC